MPEYYEIKLEGHLDYHWADWFAEMKISYIGENMTLLSGVVADQAALHGLLERVRDLNIPLISVIRGAVQVSNGKQGYG